MISQFLKTSIVLLLLSMGCKQETIVSQKITKTEVTKPSKDTIINSLENKEYSLRIQTFLSNDTLNVVDYKEDKYSSPIITFQKLAFYHKNELIKEYTPPLRSVEKDLIAGKILSSIETPIYKMCLSNNYYIIQGSDYCNGSNCKEFIGIYSMNGDVIYEGFSNEKKKTSLKDIVLKYNINLNKPTNFIKIEVW